MCFALGKTLKNKTHMGVIVDNSVETFTRGEARKKEAEYEIKERHKTVEKTL